GPLVRLDPADQGQAADRPAGRLSRESTGTPEGWQGGREDAAVARLQGGEEISVGAAPELRGEDDRRGRGEERPRRPPPAALEPLPDRPASAQAGSAAVEVAAVVAEALGRLLQQVGAGAEEGEVVEGEDER